MYLPTFTAVLESPKAVELDTRIPFTDRDAAEEYLDKMWAKRDDPAAGLDFRATRIERGERWAELPADAGDGECDDMLARADAWS